MPKINLETFPNLSGIEEVQKQKIKSSRAIGDNVAGLKKLNENQRKIAIESWVNEIDKKDPKKTFTQASIVRLANQLPITMFGRHITNTIDNLQPKERKEYRLHPYEKQGTGVSVTVCYYHKGELYFILSQKKNAKQYDQVGGYTKGHWLEGGEKVIDVRTDDERDADEEAILGNVNAINININSQQTKKIAATVEYSLSQLKEEVTKIYIEMLKQHPDFNFDINPIEMKAELAKRGINMNTQFNYYETVFDEVFQELGLDLKPLNIKPELVFAAGDMAISNQDPRLHNQVCHLAAFLGNLPAHPTFTPGSDIAKAIIVPASLITPAFSKGPEQDCSICGDMPIRRDYGTVTLTRIANFIRNKCIKESSKIEGEALFSEVENVIAHLKIVLKKSNSINIDSLLGQRPHNHFGKTASLFYAKVELVAEELAKNFDKPDEHFLQQLHKKIQQLDLRLSEELAQVTTITIEHQPKDDNALNAPSISCKR